MDAGSCGGEGVSECWWRRRALSSDDADRALTVGRGHAIGAWRGEEVEGGGGAVVLMGCMVDSVQVETRIGRAVSDQSCLAAGTTLAWRSIEECGVPGGLLAWDNDFWFL